MAFVRPASHGREGAVNRFRCGDRSRRLVTLNGELVSDGALTYSYDALSRLTEVRSNGILVASNSYDHQGRRVRLVTQAAAHTFLYDGWNVVLELVEHGGVTDRIEYYWGKDISGTLQGAGGVGGLFT